MNPPQFTTNEIIIAIVVIVALVVLALVVHALHRRRTQRLRAQFGPEYDRTVALTGARAKAEARLAQRTERVHKFNVRPLAPAERERFIEEWGRVQSHFVDAPAGAVAEADQLIGDVMANCGYPVGEFEQRAADISVDHPVVTQNYRAAHEIALRQAGGRATTEELRRAMIHYRALFDELVAAPRVTDPRPVEEVTFESGEIIPRRRAS